MPSSKKPRKRYRPRAVLPDTVSFVLGTFKPLSPEGVLRTLAINHDALASLVKGEGTEDHWRLVCSALNMALVLDEQVYDEAYNTELKAALEAHASCGVRRWNGHNFGYSGPELQAMNLGMEIHDEQMRQATVGEVERAIAETRRREQDKQRHYTVRERAEALNSHPTR